MRIIWYYCNYTCTYVTSAPILLHMHIYVNILAFLCNLNYYVPNHSLLYKRVRICVMMPSLHEPAHVILCNNTALLWNNTSNFIEQCMYFNVTVLSLLCKNTWLSYITLLFNSTRAFFCEIHPLYLTVQAFFFL